MELKIAFPIKKAYKSDYYALIIEDANGVIHYFTETGEYDGYSEESTLLN